MMMMLLVYRYDDNDEDDDDDDRVIGVSIYIADWRGSDCISILGGHAKVYLVERQ